MGVVVYVLVGGMRASLIADYIHTTVTYAILLTFAFTVYATSDLIGSPSPMHAMLIDTATSGPATAGSDIRAGGSPIVGPGLRTSPFRDAARRPSGRPRRHKQPASLSGSARLAHNLV